MEIEVYCDESRLDLLTTKKKTTDRYMVIGSIWIPKDYRSSFKNKIKQIRAKYGVLRGEIKWKNVSPSQLDFYKEIIALFFEEGDKIGFRCIVVDTEQVDLETYHESDPELGFYKFYYQLLYHWIKLENNNRYFIFTDIKTTRMRNRLSVLHDVLKNACPSANIVSVQAIPSKESIFIQLTDLLVGVVGYSCHSYFLSPAKSKIVELVTDEIKRNPSEGTFRDERKFNVFRIRLNEVIW